MTAPTTTHELDLTHLTVIAIDERGGGERFDLNAGGEPCRTMADLRAFVAELCRQGAYGPAVRDELLSEIPAPETRCYPTPGLAPGYPGAPTLPVGIELLADGSAVAHYVDEPSETYPSLSALLEAHPITEESWATVPAELRIALLGEKAAEDERAIRRLPPQDAALVAEGGAPLATSGREAIVAWYRSAARAGDMDLVEAIDRLGEGRAAELYEAAAPWLQEVR